MNQGVSGYFDIPGTSGYGFAGRFFYSEEYEKTTGKRVVSITGISIQSTIYGGTWWPGGTVAVEGETLGSMTYEGTSTHTVTVNADGVWYSVGAIADRGGEFPWVSSEIESNADGKKTVTFDVDITLFRNSSSPRPKIQGTFSVDLTNIPLGLVYIKENGEFVPYQVFCKNGENWDLHIPYIKNGESWDVCG